MPDDLTKKRPEDAKKINTSQSYEMKRWAKKLDCSEEKLKAATDEVGSNVADVEQWLKEH